MNNNRTIDFLQVFRGIAALMVVIHHIWLDLPFYFKKNYSHIQIITDLGKYGVDFFFVLSGFIISYSYLKKPFVLKEYLINRCIRIYLPYLPIALLYIIGYSLFPSLSNVETKYNEIASITLLPIGKPVLAVAWTLMHEIIFYIFFAIALLNVKYFNRFFFCWASIIIATMLLKIEYSDTYADYFIKTIFSPYNLEFILGYLCYIVINKIPKNNYSLIFAIILMLISFILKILMIELGSFGLNFIFAFSCFFFIVYAYSIKEKRINKSNIFMKLGFASYSIYLIHLPVQVVLCRVIPTYNVFFSFVSIFSVAILAGLVYSYFFEDRFLNYAKKIINR
jgi:exopolysaccharide production protein ExoZ